MKKPILLTVIIFAVFIIEVQKANARNLFIDIPYIFQNNHFKSPEVNKYKTSDKSSDSSSDIYSSRNLHFGTLNISTIRLQKLIEVEFEREFYLEKWMLNINDDNWSDEAEEPLKLEGWMLNPTNWLNQR